MMILYFTGISSSLGFMAYGEYVACCLSSAAHLHALARRGPFCIKRIALTMTFIQQRGRSATNKKRRAYPRVVASK
jgi:hypothetical protein